jgi:hypothetical protein
MRARAPGIRSRVRIRSGTVRSASIPDTIRAYGVPGRRTGHPVVVGEDRLEVAGRLVRREDPSPDAVLPGLPFPQALAPLRRRPVVAADGRFARFDARERSRDVPEQPSVVPRILAAQAHGRKVSTASAMKSRIPAGRSLR